MNRTIPEIATNLGIDKGRIYRLLKKVEVPPVPNEKKQVFNEPSQELIKQYLINNGSLKTNNKSSNQTKENESKQKSKYNQTEEKNKDKIIDALINQLEQKDKQIETLGTLVTQQQQLTLQDKQTIKEQAKQIENFSVQGKSNKTNSNEKRTKKRFFNLF